MTHHDAQMILLIGWCGLAAVMFGILLGLIITGVLDRWPPWRPRPRCGFTFKHIVERLDAAAAEQTLEACKARFVDRRRGDMR